MGKGKAWDINYLTGQTPWDSKEVEPKLIKFIKKYFPKKINAIDVGCGTGTNVIYLAKLGHKAIGIDISKVAIETAKNKAKKANVKCEFYTGDVLDLSFLKEKFDFVFDRGCFHHQLTEDRKKYVNSIYKILKNNGMLLLMAICKKDTKVIGPNKVSKEELIENFSEKFKILDLKETEFQDKVNPLGYVCVMKKI